MQILCTPTYEKQLKDILDEFALQDFLATKKFKLYLDTILVNLPTKAHKYKQSALFNDENIKEIPHEAYNVIFFHDKTNNNYLIMGILKK